MFTRHINIARSLHGMALRGSQVCYIDRDAQGGPKGQQKGAEKPKTTKASHHGGQLHTPRSRQDPSI